MRKSGIWKKLCAVALFAVPVVLLAGCTSIAKKTDSAASKEEGALSVSDSEIDLSEVKAAPEEDDTVDQGREGRPSDSWNADVPEADDDDVIIPIEDESDLSDDADDGESGDGEEEEAQEEYDADAADFAPLNEDGGKRAE